MAFEDQDQGQDQGQVSPEDLKKAKPYQPTAKSAPKPEVGKPKAEEAPKVAPMKPPAEGPAGKAPASGTEGTPEGKGGEGKTEAPSETIKRLRETEPARTQGEAPGETIARIRGESAKRSEEAPKLAPIESGIAPMQRPAEATIIQGGAQPVRVPEPGVPVNLPALAPPAELDQAPAAKLESLIQELSSEQKEAPAVAAPAKPEIGAEPAPIPIEHIAPHQPFTGGIFVPPQAPQQAQLSPAQIQDLLNRIRMLTSRRRRRA